MSVPYGAALDLVRATLAAVLEWPAERVDVAAGFFDLGLDSRMAAEFGARLEAALGQELPTTLLFDHPTTESLAGYLAGLARQADGAPAPTPPPTPPSLAERPAAPVAVIGMGCRMPGARNPAEFWDLLRRGGDAVTDVPPGRWDADEFYHPDPRTPGASYTRRGAFLPDFDLFEPGFFGISPREAAEMDPQQRLFLEVGWEALEDAGQSADLLAGSQTGVFMGVTGADYTWALYQRNAPAELTAHSLTGVASTFTTGRLSYWLGLHGPNLSVDTACSSSLVAVHLAVRSLRAGECAMALAGGVNMLLTPEMFIVLSKAGMLAPDGRCKTFDRAADGYGRGEGCGVVVLKPLPDALAAGDRVLAVIRGTAVNSDGRTAGITVPGGQAQQAVIRQALRDAGVDGARVGYVEAHGTGTALGDPIEVRALSGVLTPGRARGPLAIGSVKTNIGHLEAAAGVAGLIKTVLSLQHEQIPPTLHLTEVNPEMPLDELGVTVPVTLTPWPRGGGERVAGVSAFGASGTNAHVIVSEAPEIPAFPAAGPDRPAHLVTLSARSEQALAALAGRYREHLAAAPAGPLPDLAYTANHGRAHFGHRLAITARTAGDLDRGLAGYLDGSGSGGAVSGAVSGGGRPAVGFLFTGQGSQYPGMGRELYETQPGFRADLDRCDEVLRPLLGRSLPSLLFPGSPGSRHLIDQTRYTQPALFALQYALARLWWSWGIEPAAMLGHSVGEYAAACLAGVLRLDEALSLVAERGALMQALPAGGAMAALPVSEARAIEILAPHRHALSLAAVNGPQSVVVSGDGAELRALIARLAAGGVKAKPLAVSHAFHSPLLDPMLDDFERAAARCAIAAPRIPLVSNLTGTLAGESTYGPRYFRDHARAPVQFMAGVRQLTALGCDAFLEIGPAPVLCGMARGIAGPAARYLPSLRKGQGDWDMLFASLSQLYVNGASVDWAGVDRGHPRRRVVLPTYPFQRKRYWMKSVAGPAPSRTAATTVLGHRVPSPLAAAQYAATLTAGQHPCLAECVFEGTAVVNAGFYIEAVLEAAGLGEVRISDLTITRPLIVDDRGQLSTQLIVEPDATFRYYSHLDHNDWGLHAQGSFTATVARPGDSDLDAIQRRCGREMSGEDFYRSMSERGLEFGPSARWHDRIRRGDGEALSWLRPPAPEEAAAYRLHPGIVDAALALLSVCPAQDVPPSAVFMLVEIERFQWFGHDGEPLLCHAALRGVDHGGDSVTAGIRLLTARGRCVALLEGVHMRRTTRDVVRRSASRAVVRVPARDAVVDEADVAELRRVLREDGDRAATAALRRFLAGRAAAVLGGAVADIDPGEPLQNLGLDSLLAVELKDVTSAALGVQLPAALFMDNPSVVSLAEAVAPRLVREQAPEPAVTEYAGPGGMHVTELGQGPPLVLVHGGAVGGPDAWQTQLSLASRWRLIIPCRLNYGKSASSGREDFTEDGPLLADLAGDGAHLVAHSYGTVGAMLAAIQRPEAVWSLTLIESGASAVARHRPAVAEFERRIQALLAAPPDDPEDQFRALFAIIEPTARFPAPLPAGLQRFAKRITTGVRWPWEADLRYDVLRAAAFPTLVVSGGQRPAFEDISDVLADRIGGERLVVPGAHATQNAGSAFNTALEDFLTRARPR